MMRKLLLKLEFTLLAVTVVGGIVWQVLRLCRPLGFAQEAPQQAPQQRAKKGPGAKHRNQHWSELKAGVLVGAVVQATISHSNVASPETTGPSASSITP